MPVTDSACSTADVVHFALTPVAGSPIRIVNALNRHTTFSARLIVVNECKYGARTFPGDLNWANDRELCEHLLEAARIVHLHQFIDLQKQPGVGYDFRKLQAKGILLVRHFHSSLRSLGNGDPGVMRAIHDDALPAMVIGQYPERDFPRARLVPNIVADVAKPVKHIASKRRLGFSPSAAISAWDISRYGSRWDTKGAPEVQQILVSAVRGINAATYDIIRNVPFEQCLVRKQQCSLFVDDLVTGSYHLSGLEAMAMGIPTLNFLDGQILRVVEQLSGTTAIPWVNVRLEDALTVVRHLLQNDELRAAIGAESFAWMHQHWSEARMVSHFARAYETLLAGTDAAQFGRDPNHTKVSAATETFFKSDLHDLVYEARRAKALKSPSGYIGTQKSRVIRLVKKLIRGIKRKLPKLNSKN